MGSGLEGCKELDMTKQLTHTHTRNKDPGERPCGRDTVGKVWAKGLRAFTPSRGCRPLSPSMCSAVWQLSAPQTLGKFLEFSSCRHDRS